MYNSNEQNSYVTYFLPKPQKSAKRNLNGKENVITQFIYSKSCFQGPTLQALPRAPGSLNPALTYDRLKQICFGEPCTDNFRIHCLFTSYLLKRYGQRLFAISASLIHTNERIYPSRRSLVTQNSVFPYQFPTETKKWSANYSVLISLSVHKKKKRWWSTNFSVL